MSEHGLRPWRRGATLCALVAAGAFLAGTALAEDPQSAHQAVDQGLDDVPYDQVIEPGVPLDADKMLQVWAQKLKVLIVVDPQAVGTKIKFVQRDVVLTWGLFKKVLEFHDVILEERESRGRWILFARLRRNATSIPVVSPVLGPGEPLPQRAEVVTAFVQILHGSGTDIFAVLRGMGARDPNRIANVQFVRGPEVMILNDFAPNVDYYTRIIHQLDVPAPGQVTEVLEIKNAQAEDIARVIQQLLRPQAGPGGQPVPPGVAPPLGAAAGSAQPQVTADARTNQLIVQAYPYQFDEIRRMIGKLDIASTRRTVSYHVYDCRNVGATYLASKLQELLTGQRGSGAAKPALSKGGAASPAPGVSIAPPGPGGQPGKADYSAIETRIVPDELSNSLLIQADPETYKQILALLEGTPEQPKGLDHARRRVLIEAQVWEVSTPTDNMTIGFELADLSNAHQGSFRPAAATGFGLSSLSVDPSGQRLSRVPNLSQGLTAVLTKDTFDKLPVIMQAIANLEHSRLITTPFALTNDNEQAIFKLNQSIPYQTSVIAAGGLGTTNVQNITVPTALQVTPQVNSEENLTLEVDVNLGSVGAQGNANLPPTTNTRHYHGTVTVPNMRYVVFGGLESEQNGDVESKVPFVGDIPIVGHLFKEKQWTHSMSKVYVFIRATVFTEDRQLARVGEDLRRKVHLEAGRDAWIPPIVDPALMRGDRREVQDALFDVFGTGSGYPFRGEEPR